MFLSTVESFFLIFRAIRLLAVESQDVNEKDRERLQATITLLAPKDDLSQCSMSC
jgi:hypothetical protein